jgi:hypothetical protein
MDGIQTIIRLVLTRLFIWRRLQAFQAVSSVLATHGKLNVVFPAGLDVGVVPCKAGDESKHHGNEVIEVKGPLVGQ